MKELQETITLWKSTIEDVKEIEKFLDHSTINNPFYRRLFLRSIFSLFETYIHITKSIIKIKISTEERKSPKLSWENLFILTGKKVSLDNKGVITTKDEFQRFEPMLRYTFNLFSIVFKVESPDYGDKGFQILIKLLKRRNDITHQKTASSQIITNLETKPLWTESP